jgi:hypothetical protein
MSNSLSVDSGLSALKPSLQKRPAVPPSRPPPRPRQAQTIQFNDRPIGSHTAFADLTSAPSRLMAGSSYENDAIESESHHAVKLPLVSSISNLPPPAEVLRPIPGDKLLLVQLPSSLPIVYPNDASQMDYNPLFAAADGLLGAIRIHRSGKVTAKIGNIVFDVETGVAPSCAQMICIRKSDGLEYAQIPPNKIKLTVPVERIMAEMRREGGQT